MLKKLTEQPALDLEATINEKVDEDSLFNLVALDEQKAEKVAYSTYSYWGSTLQLFFKSKIAIFFTFVIISLLLFSILQPYLPNQYGAIEVTYNPETRLPNRNVPPGEQHWFGTNSIGQDLWALIWSGTRTSLFIGFTVATVEALIGIIVGVLWGYIKKLDTFFTELYNVLNNIPQTIVLVIMSYILTPGLSTVIFAMCLTGWLATARFIRNQVIIIRDRDYNLASQALGTPTRRIIMKNLLPYLVSVIMLRMALAIPSAISNEIFITYIGLGLPVDTPSLGNLLNKARPFITSTTQRYQLIFPVTIISLITVSFYVIGNTFADAADPKNHV